jgi:Cu/Ag efflux protein CusF
MTFYRSLRSVALIACLALSSANAYADEAYSFKVKGVVRGLPGQGLAKDEILVKHEEIPEYRDQSGAVVGMMAMTMPFYLSPDVTLGGIAVGDRVELRVEQHLKPEFSEKVVEIKKAE